MMKKTLLYFVVFIMVVIPAMPSRTVYGYQNPTHIRVGLESQYKEADSISILNNSLLVGYAPNGVFIQQGLLQSAAGFTARPIYGACVQAPGSFTGYDQAKQFADAYANGYVPALSYNDEWLIYKTQFSSDQAAQSEASAIGGTYYPASSSRVGLYSGTALTAVFDNTFSAVQILDANNGRINLGSRTYRSAVELGRYSGNKLTAVNVLTINEYLYSVVASEMYPSFQIEALKAQAVAARSYTLTRMGIHKEQGYEVCDKVHCQHYLGASGEAESTIRAVDGTGNQVAYYNGEPINAVYFSSSGGVTDDSGNVWLTNLPYLKSVSEISEYEPKIWTRTFTLSEINSLLTANNVSIGAASAVAITRTSPSGRVQELTIYGASGTKTLTKEDIRTFFSPSAEGTLESRNFTIQSGVVINSDTPVNTSITTGNQYTTFTDGTQVIKSSLADAYAAGADGLTRAVNAFTVYDGVSTVAYDTFTTTDTTSDNFTTIKSTGNSVVFSGRGWGHGVGMSQCGAEGLARLGYDYQAILKHYYTGIVIA